MNKISKNGWLVIAILIAIAATVFMWPKVATHPDLILLGSGGDATKNYYTYLYQSLYGQGFWFQGMNYPYGEHTVYIDGQPILSVSLAYLRQYIHVDKQVVLTVMHIAILLAYALGIVYVYKALVHFKVSAPIAIIFSVFIQALSPHVFRVFAHYGLSYACVVPMLLYWSVKFFETSYIRYAAYVLVLGSMMSFFHPYFAAIVLVWGVFYAVAVLMSGSRHRMRLAALMLAAVVAIVLLVKVVMYMTDPVTDRPGYPSGLLTYCTTGHDIFTSPHSPIWKLLVDENDHRIISTGGEGHAYMGLAALALVICGVVSLLLNRGRKTADKIEFPPAFLLLAFLALLLSMGVPFVWGMDWLFDYVSAFRQFRTMGRFAWIWYYILSVFSVIVLYGYYIKYKAEKKKALANILLSSAMLVWGIEAYGNRLYVMERCKPLWDNYAFLFSHSEQDWKEKLHSYGYSSNDFQAILSLPYYHLGSDKLWQYYDEVAWLQVLTCKASLQLALPYANAYMARSSWSQTFAQVKIQGGPYAEKALVHTNDERPFLVFVRVTDTLSDPDQKYILDACEYIGQKEDDLKAYKLYPSALRARDSMHRAAAREKLATTGLGDAAFNVPAGGFWYVNHFDTCNTLNGFSGKALSYKNDEYQVLAEVAVPVADTPRLYEFSAWVLLDSSDYRSPYFDVECYGLPGELAKYAVPAHGAQDTKGMWVRASEYFVIPAGCNKIRCVLFARPRSSYRAADELLLRPAEALIISKDKAGKTLVNNHSF